MKVLQWLFRASFHSRNGKHAVFRRVNARFPARSARGAKVDKGADAGIRVGMPVVTGAGLVGRIVEVGADRASVQLVTDPEFRVGVRLVTSQRFGTASGQGAGRDLLVDTGIEPGEDDADIPDVEIVTTSGIDDRSSFPALIPVGRVSRVREANGGLTVELFIEPLADLDELSFVDVLLTSPVG